PKAGATFAGSMPVRLRQIAPREIAVAFEKTRLMGLERLADTVDEHLLGRARTFQRIARPNHHVSPAARRKAADFTAKSDRFRRFRSDHRQRLAPAHTGRAGHALKRDKVAGVLPLHKEVSGI